MSGRTLLIACTCVAASLVLCGGREARAQGNQGSPAASSPAVLAPADDGPAVWVRFEARRDRYRYRFENPSRFNTSTLVPHDFEQTYRGDNRWIVAGARYGLGPWTGETEVGLAPGRATQGTDYDTFHQPDGNVIVYGTSADVTLRSFRVSQTLESAPRDGWTVRGRYSYQRDAAVFAPSFSTTTQSRPPSFTSFWNTGRESTASQVHEVQLGVGRAVRLSRSWRLRATGDVAPVRLARLTTSLPDKYPGRDILFQSKGISLSSAAVLRWSRRLVSLDVSVAHYHTWNYRSSAQFHRDSLAAGASVRVSPR